VLVGPSNKFKLTHFRNLSQRWFTWIYCSFHVLINKSSDVSERRPSKPLSMRGKVDGLTMSERNLKTVHFQHQNPLPTGRPNMEQHSRGHGQPSASTISYPNSAPVETLSRGLESRPKTHSSAETRPKEVYSCQQCSKVFNRRENLSRHVKTRE
jgi:hypothetical protein